jgi:hypothetical protein
MEMSRCSLEQAKKKLLSSSFPVESNGGRLGPRSEPFKICLDCSFSIAEISSQSAIFSHQPFYIFVFRTLFLPSLGTGKLSR